MLFIRKTGKNSSSHLKILLGPMFHRFRYKVVNSFERVYFEKRAPKYPVIKKNLGKFFPELSHVGTLMRLQLLCKWARILLAMISEIDVTQVVLVFHIWRMQDYGIVEDSSQNAEKVLLHNAIGTWRDCVYSCDIEAKGPGVIKNLETSGTNHVW